MLIAFNKPAGVVCQFSALEKHITLAQFIDVPRVYAAGRLDSDSEGLLLLTDDGRLQQRIAAPTGNFAKRYWCQVEGQVSAGACAKLVAGVSWARTHGEALAAHAIAPPEDLWPREPPIRVRREISTDWLEITLDEGQNRQVRHMTAAVGLPTLRLIRVAIGPIELFELELAPGAWRFIEPGALGTAPSRRRRA